MKATLSFFTLFLMAVSVNANDKSLSCTGIYAGNKANLATFTIPAESVAEVGEGEMTDFAENRAVIGQYEVTFEGKTAEGTNEASVVVTDTQTDNTSSATAVGNNPGEAAVVNFDIRGSSAINLNVLCVYK